jgi:hypothetical protein
MKDSNSNKSHYTIYNFLPLIAILIIIFLLTFIRQFLTGYDFSHAMTDFMGFFFSIFGGFKILNLQKFAESYQTYDILAKQSRWYAFVYPFLEILLGTLYITRSYLYVANVSTVILMSISALGVFQALLKKEQFECACLGTVFKIPMTYVTLLEDVLMAGMALYMIFN